MYRNHPLIIALDHGHYFLLEHPLIQQLMLRKWKLYRSLFYFPRILTLILLIFLTLYVLITPAPNLKKSLSPNRLSIPIQWIVIILSIINLLKILVEIFLYHSLRISFAQLFGIISYLSSIVAFLPNQISLQWQITSFAILFQWFNIAIILRSVSFFGNSIVMIESILKKFLILLFVLSPLLIGFSISINMIFYNQSSFITVTKSLHKTSSMILGEYDADSLLFSKSTFTIGIFLLISFIFIMSIVFVNLLLGITIGDGKNSKKKAQDKASK